MTGQKAHPVAVAVLIVGALAVWGAVVIAGMVWMPAAVPWLIFGPLVLVLLLAQLA